MVIYVYVWYLELPLQECDKGVQTWLSLGTFNYCHGPNMFHAHPTLQVDIFWTEPQKSNFKPPIGI